MAIANEKGVVGKMTLVSLAAVLASNAL